MTEQPRNKLLSKKSRGEVQKTLFEFYQNPIAKISVELFFTIGAVLFFALMAIRPTLITMSRLLRDLEDKRELDVKLGQKVAALGTVEETYKSLEPRLDELEYAIPNRPKLTLALKILERLASDSSLVIGDITVVELPPEEEAPPSEKSTLEELPILLSVQGDYSSIRNFVESINQNKRLFLVDTIVFSVNEEGETRILSAGINITIYYYE